jgi:hypothetical protein
MYGDIIFGTLYYIGKQIFLLFSLASKNESRLIKSPVCLCVSVCHPLITFEPLGRLSFYFLGR